MASLPPALAPLRSWMNALGGMARLGLSSRPKTVREVHETGIVWASFPEIDDFAADDEDEVMQYAYEAIQMLMILTQAGRYNEWAQVVLAVWPEDGKRWLEIVPSWRTGGFRIGYLSSVETTNSLVAWARVYVLSEGGPAQTARLRELLKETFSLECLPVTRRCVVPVHLELFPGGVEDRTDATRVLFEATSVVRHQRALLLSADDAGNLVYPRFALVELWIMDDVTWTELQWVNEMVESGIRVTLLPMQAVQVEEQSGLVFTPIMRNLVSSGMRHKHVHGASVVDLPSRMGPRTTSAVYSALMDSQSVREISVRTPEDLGALPRTNAKVWRWLALSVFSADATNTIDSLQLDLDDLSANDVAAMNALIQAPNPLAIFYATPEDTHATTFASTFRLSDFPGDGPELSLASAAIEVRVLDRRDNGAAVFLPGFGRAWVDEAQCQLRPKQPLDRGQCRSVREIHLTEVMESTLSRATALLRVIGSGARRLILDKNFRPAVEISEACYADIFGACRNLEALELRDFEFGSLESLYNCFERGLTRVSDLTICSYEVDTFRASDLAHVLADDTRAITRQLTHLSVRVNKPRDTVAEFQSALHAMLSSNFYLQNISFEIFYGAENGRAIDEAFKNEFDGAFVRGRGGPLPLPTKLGFLSVVSNAAMQSRGAEVRAVGQLDHGVLALIFTFAAHSKTRHLRVHISQRTWPPRELDPPEDAMLD